MTSFAASQTLASSSSTWLFTGVGVVIVAVLIGAFWFGSRRTARKPMPPQAPQPGADSWQPPEASQGQEPTDPEHRA
ncbi:MULTISPECIES: DUF6479 family protein [unclassified Streptomyces]|uniref:DUF6479 family protein n=1 Tax=unclassified Streptomyces TaxID=2593676 RepID=UPI000CB4A73E|nr:DUF6479 family protein [Streptomyces sp. CB01201]PJN01781.1 hypothetical protein CG740_18635 [Streptomyces sp. CB01201]